MDEVILRKAVNYAHQNGEKGMFIWACYRAWDEYPVDLKPGEIDYEDAIQGFEKQEYSLFQWIMDGWNWTAFISVPTEKIASDNNFFNEILTLCNQKRVNGPFTFIPSGKNIDFSA
jgi:hypothetical protein